ATMTVNVTGACVVLSGAPGSTRSLPARPTIPEGTGSVNVGVDGFEGAARSVSYWRSGTPAIVDGTVSTTCADATGVAFASKARVPVSVTLGAAARSNLSAGLSP